MLAKCIVPNCASADVVANDKLMCWRMTEQRRPIAEGQQLWVNYGRDYFFGQNGEPIDRGFDY